MLLFQTLFTGADLTPLTRHTFLWLSWNGPACFAAAFQVRTGLVFFFFILSQDLEGTGCHRGVRTRVLCGKRWQAQMLRERSDGSDLWWPVWFRRSSRGARCTAPQTARGEGKESEPATSMCFWYVGAIILIWPRLNQMSNLPNYKITVLAGTVTRVNFSLISLLPEDIWFFSTVFYLSFPFLSSGRDLWFNSISPAAEHPGNYLFLPGQCALDGEEIDYHPLWFACGY